MSVADVRRSAQASCVAIVDNSNVAVDNLALAVDKAGVWASHSVKNE